MSFYGIGLGWVQKGTLGKFQIISDYFVASHMVSKADNRFNDAFVRYERPWYPYDDSVHGLEMTNVSV